MNIANLSAAPKPGDLTLEELAKHPQIAESQKIAELSRQFEAVLLRQLLQQARKTLVTSRFNPDAKGNAIYDDLLNAQLADNMSKGGGLGLAAGLKQQLAQQLLKRGATEPDTPPSREP